MSAKRPTVDLMALTSDQAVPMAEAVQRMASTDAAAPAAPVKTPARSKAGHVGTANLEALAFKVPRSFRKRFRSRAADADMKLNELLFAAFDAWEAQNVKK